VVKLKAVIHETEDGWLWAEIPEMPGCCAQGCTREELFENLREAAEGCLACRLGDLQPGEPGQLYEARDPGPTIEIVE
jgi:predicted RNase H-like HicB family nuclease